ncbi:TonB-dependent receptor domain-containing protein [Sphingomonas sp. JC676]|uniref:TonB-dependent receptor n=1 Tax=Sphingomonas sp. JC676 TaxID=2768065 RepID=UPI00292A57DA|nr:TonB-dependent receptor [Sphingomonas sp. JC676]
MINSNILRANLARGISGAALAAALAISAPAQAQTTASLRGHVDGVTAGAVVTATDNNTGQAVTGTVNANGEYFIPGLRPGTYSVQVAGGPEAETVVVPVGQTVVYDIAAASANAEIVVTGRTGGRNETRTATITTNISQGQIDNLPQNDRNFLNFAALAPGVSVTPSGTNRQVQAGATSSDNTNVFIDGLSLKNPINHGGVAGQNFSKGNPFPQLAVQEFKIDTQNFKAEYEQAGSAIITAVTKTGGQDFHGDLFGEWQPKSFIGRPYFDRPGHANNPTGATPKPDYNRWQYGADLGGPIIKDVLHFYAAFEGTDQKLPSTGVNFQVGDNVPAPIASQFNGSYPQTFNQKLYFGKLSLFATADDTINASAFLRREKNLSDFGGNSVPEHGRTLNSEINVFQVDWSHRGSNWLNEFTVAYNTVENGTPRASDAPEVVLTRAPDISSGEVAYFGGNSFIQNDHQKTFTVKNNVTFYGGNHVIKAGGKVVFNQYERLEDSRNNGTYYYNAATFSDPAVQTPTAARISTVPVLPASANNTQIGLFVQDDWTPDEHWTFNLGLRWDYETNAKNENFVTPAKVAAALRAYQGWKAAGINPEDYISTGNNRDPDWKAFQPRLGVSYDVNGDRDLIFFAGAGRYYDRPLFIASGIETIKNYYQSISTITFCNGTGVVTPPAGCIPFQSSLRDPAALRAAAIAQGVGGDVWLLNNDTKLPFSDQFNVGIRKRFGAIQTSLSFSHIRSHNIFRYVRGNRLPDGTYTSQGDQWIEDNFPPAGQLPGFQGKLNIGDNHGKAVYNAIYITAEKPFTGNARWGFTSSLTLQRARTNVAQELANNDEFYNGPRVDVYGWNYVQGVEKFRFVGTGIARGPFGTVLSGTLTLGSGPAFGNIIFKPNPPENACCYANMGGVFFPHETFGYSNLDLRIAKKFKMPYADGHELEVSFAAFNVFDTVNRSYSAWGAGSGENPTFEENGTIGLARSFQVGAKYKF